MSVNVLFIVGLVFVSNLWSMVEFLFPMAIIAFALIRQKYFKDFVLGSKTSPDSHALVCPTVALNVMLHFFINKGLVSAAVVDKYSLDYWGLAAIALAS